MHLPKILSIAFLTCFAATFCLANTITFGLVPGDGEISFEPLETSGWGYSIQNATSYWVLPLGLSNSGVLYGSLVDIFDYPVVDPGQTAFQAYSYNAPGGFGSSLGLFEYTMPADVPLGLHQSGIFSLTYQLYDANPDLNFDALPVGFPETQSVSFDVSAGRVTEVPEPSTFILVATGVGILLLRGSRTRSRRNRG